ncbi:MAG TPA: hypothetical protein P5268_07995 [Candidatus Marinimicrobia bacterium]|nr:hypothetical protein [Candidatus Neomarinimicrobiota bacterium]HRS52766.1 hypothetical protein [Candidatus Neomarinimicrobiota bacterium]HRU92955.1 hypothetical protein [Candidatus Neomarinimicrobiota bacterium]
MPEKQIFFQINSIKLISYYIKPNKDFKPDSTIQIQVTSNFNIIKENAIISVVIKFNFSQNNKDLMGIEAAHNFKFKDPSDLSDCTRDNLKLPRKLIKSLLAISISGTRGLHAMINANSPYSKIYIPLIDPSKLIKRSQK